MLHLHDQLVNMDLKHLWRLELMASEEHMLAEREPAPPARPVGIVVERGSVTEVSADRRHLAGCRT